MDTLGYILTATIGVSAISLIGILFTQQLIQRTLRGMVSFAAGAMIGAAFLDILPEAMEHSPAPGILSFTLLGFVLFFMLERFIFWAHCHRDHCDVHPFTYLNLIGDGLHNFLDGTIIAAGFITSPGVGITATLAIIFHEIPQELGDFAVLIYGGLSKGKALALNFASALTAIAGALAAYHFSIHERLAAGPLVAIAAGGFIYIAAADLIPEIHREKDRNRSFVQLLLFLLGMGVIKCVTVLVAHH